MTETAPARFAVRSAAPSDARALAGIQVRSWRAAYPGIVPAPFLRSLSVDRREEAWGQILGETRSQTYVAVAGETIAGWISVGASRDGDATPAIGELWGIYVDPAQWGRGAGRALWARGRAHLLAAGFAEAVLWVFKDNRRAQRFYRAIGFAPDGAEKPLDFDGALVPEIRFHQRLVGH